VTGDDFYRDIPEGHRWALTAAQGAEEYFDWQRLRQEVLEPLRAGRRAQYHPFSWLPGGGLGNRMVRVQPTPIIVLEGVYTGGRNCATSSTWPSWWRRPPRNAGAG
jgi:uridine kinase